MEESGGRTDLITAPYYQQKEINCLMCVKKLFSHSDAGQRWADGNGGQAYFTNDLTTTLSVSRPPRCMGCRTATPKMWLQFGQHSQLSFCTNREFHSKV